MAWLRHKMPEKLKRNHNVRLGELELRGTELRCLHLRNSKWGVLAKYHDDNPKQQAWILYAQLDMKQLGNNRLKYAKMSLDFESETERSDGVIVTEYYGPKHIRGSPEMRAIREKVAPLPEVTVGPVAVKPGTYEWESTQERVERWHFDAMLKPGRVGGNLLRRIDWTITETRHASDPDHNPEWKLGVVLTHDREAFKIHLGISISFINARGIFQLGSRTKRTSTEVGQQQEELESPELDETAALLPSVLLSENLKPVPTMGKD